MPFHRRSGSKEVLRYSPATEALAVVRARYAILAALLWSALINWKMTLAMMFYGAIFTGAWATLKMLTRRKKP